MASLSAQLTQGCASDGSGGVLTITSASVAAGSTSSTPAYTWAAVASDGNDYGFGFDPANLPLSAFGLPNGVVNAQVTAYDAENNVTYFSRPFSFTIDCSTGPVMPGQLVLNSLSHTDETQAGGDGTATIQASGGTAPLTAQLVELSLSQPATSGQPSTFGPVPASTYTLRITDSSTPTAQVVQGQVTVLPYAAPVAGCIDEYADNYDPTATVGNNSCTYTPRWRSAWQPMAVRVAAQAGQTEAFIKANLRIGFRPGHPLAADRPLGAPLALRATVAPDGYATFVLGPYLRPQLGAPDGSGGYRLDLNSATPNQQDLYTGYELRRTDGTLLEHGYALNAAVPDNQLVVGTILSPYGENTPVWTGFSFLTGFLTGALRYPTVDATDYADWSPIRLPCPLNPLPITWLAPGGGYGYWVFQGRPQLGDDVGDGQQYREPATGQRRYADPGEAYQTVKATSGVFKGDALLTGLRTLWRSPQAWYQPVPGGEWVPIVVERGSREVGRLGVLKNEVTISFQVAAPEFSQGQ